MYYAPTTPLGLKVRCTYTVVCQKRNGVVYELIITKLCSPTNLENENGKDPLDQDHF